MNKVNTWIAQAAEMRSLSPEVFQALGNQYPLSSSFRADYLEMNGNASFLGLHPPLVQRIGCNTLGP